MKRNIIIITTTCLLCACSTSDTHYDGPYVADVVVFINSDTLDFHYNGFSEGSQFGSEYFQIDCQEPDTFNPSGADQLSFFGSGHHLGIYLINNSAFPNYPATFNISSLSPTDTTIYYKTYMMTSSSDSNFIQLNQLSVDSINGIFQCYVRAYNDSVYTGLEKATGYFNFLIPIH